MPLHDIPAYALTALHALEELSDDELWRLMCSTMPQDQYKRLTELREQRRDGTLNSDDQAELDQLLEAADMLTLEKAYAAVLLKLRGHLLPRLAD